MELRVRFVERPLSETKMTGQTAAVQSDSSLRQATISDAGLAMMASIVGKRLPKYLRDHIGCALLDTMVGNFDDDGETEGDVFASVYGEILGPLFTCLERDGDFTVIRLVRHRERIDRTKRADLLLLDQSSGLVMLQECKGHCSDYYSVAEDSDSLDICQRMRNLRNVGKRQLIWPAPDQIGTRRVRLSSFGKHIALPFLHGERSVVVTAVPDGRTASPSFSPDVPSHENCEASCKSCLFNGGPTLITVLSVEDIPDSKCFGPDERSFLDWYKACERAIWGRAHGSFGQAYSSLLGAWRQMETSTEEQRRSIPFLTGLVEEAVNRKVFVDFRPIWRAFEKTTPMPEELIAMIRELHDVQGEMHRPHIHEGSARQLGQMLFGGEYRERPSTEEIIGNWQFQVGMERGNHQREALPAEANISERASGLLELVMVPQSVSQESSPDNLQWGLSEILAGDRIPPEIIYDAFVEEEVAWTNIEREEIKRYRLGRSLRGPWFPFLTMIYSQRLLDEMRHCCPECDMLADMIANWQRHWSRYWKEPFFYHHMFEHHHQRSLRDRIGGRWDLDADVIAYVTSDARAFLRIPNLS
ncbi:MAG: hypothetical protein NTW96_22560 [Planctomycetia bacterium]|nr:hypothetical protein [Planctomycetia bacterium]